MKKIAFVPLTLALFAVPAYAQNAEALCKLMTTHKPATDVAYQAGMDVNGNPVAPADGSTGLTKPVEIVSIPLTLDLAQSLSAPNLPANAEMNAPVGMLQVHSDGKVVYNGEDLSEEAVALCANPAPIRQAQAEMAPAEPMMDISADEAPAPLEAQAPAQPVEQPVKQNVEPAIAVPVEQPVHTPEQADIDAAATANAAASYRAAVQNGTVGTVIGETKPSAPLSSAEAVPATSPAAEVNYGTSGTGEVSGLDPQEAGLRSAIQAGADVGSTQISGASPAPEAPAAEEEVPAAPPAEGNSVTWGAGQ